MKKIKNLKISEETHQILKKYCEVNGLKMYKFLESLIKKNCIRDSLRIMNINLKSKNEIQNMRREIMQKRVLTGKKVKITNEERVLLI